MSIDNRKLWGFCSKPEVVAALKSAVQSQDLRYEVNIT